MENEMTYLNVPYKGSIAYHNVMSATESQLRNQRPYYEIAILTHKKQGNEGQVKFFSDGLELIDKRLKKFERQETEQK